MSPRISDAVARASAPGELVELESPPASGWDVAFLVASVVAVLVLAAWLAVQGVGA